MTSKKLAKVSYSSLKTQSYMTSKNISHESVKNIFKYRTHMLDFDENFKEKDTVTKVCKLCKSHPDSQDSLEDCHEIKKHVDNIVSIKQLYNEDFDDKAIEVFIKVLETRTRLLDTSC